MLSESISLYKSIEKVLLCVGKNTTKSKLSDNEHEALSDTLAALNMGQIALVEHAKSWDEMYRCECCGWTKDDSEYADAVKFTFDWLTKENYCEQ